jgi:hypothetical protein
MQILAADFDAFSSLIVFQESSQPVQLIALFTTRPAERPPSQHRAANACRWVTMSGAEVAGFVLAAIPLLISGLEHYAEGVTTIRRYLKYKNELRSLLRNLNTEYDIFRNTCEELLEGIVPARKMALLLENPGSDLWKDQVIEQKLKNRLQSSYSGYLETVDDMEDAVNEFKRRLKLGSDGKVHILSPHLIHHGTHGKISGHPGGLYANITLHLT